MPERTAHRATSLSGLSEADARFRMHVEDGVFVTMRDGVRIAVRIYRPDGPGPFPTLFAASPYQIDTDPLPHSGLFLWHEIGPVEWYVRKHGYAYVHADVRGSGRSEGTYGLLSPDEARDLYEIIQWIGGQTWSNGRVGGIGQSYYAWSQWFMGIQNPPALKCIAPFDGCTDMYRDTAYCGGIYGEFLAWWYNLVRANNLHRAANAPTGRLMSADIASEIISHQTYDSWWKDRCALERITDIKVPIFSIGHWGKIDLHLRGNIMGYEGATAPKKLLVTGRKDVFEVHELFNTVEFHEQELLPFYDHHLKEEKNGFEDRAPVRLYVRGRDAYREEQQWPPEKMSLVPYYLGAGPSASVTSLNDGVLSDKAAAGAEQTSYSYPDPRWKLGTVVPGKGGLDPVAGALTFTTPPLADDLEVAGPMVLEIFASSTNVDTDFFVKVSDQHPQDGAERKAGRQPQAGTVTKGWLRASHRAKDEAKSRPWQPVHTHTDPQPLEPGRVYKFEIEVMPCAYRFRKGHRIRLEIVNGDSPITEGLFTHLYHWYKVGTDTIHHGASYPSRLLVPVVPLEG